MASLSSRPSVGRKPVGHAAQQQGAQRQGVAAVPYVQAGYQQQQMQMQQPTYVQGQQQPMLQQNSYQQLATQHPQTHQQLQQLQQPVQRQPLQQQPVQSQQHVQHRTAQQWPVQQQQPQQVVYQQPVMQQQQPPQQQTIYQQQTRQQPVQQQTQQRPVQQYQQPVQQQPAQQHSSQPQSVQQLQQRLQRGPVQQQSLQQQPLQQQQIQQQPLQQQPLQQQPIQQQPIQQQPLQQQPLQQQPLQQQPLQQQFSSQASPTPSNAASHAINRQSISSAASVRSMGSVTSSHTNPSQALGSSTSFPASIFQQDTPDFITCTLCSADITNDSSRLECLACTAAQVPTRFCTPCCVSKGAVTNHHHHMSNLVSPSDVVTFDPDVSAHGWDVRKTAIGITWYHHKGSKIKTFEKPKPPIPVAQPQIFPGDSNLDDGWEEIKDPDGRLFYYHRATKVSKWTRPPRNQLPLGWVECTNPDGRTYYLNNITQATTWERPSTRGAVLDTTGWSPTEKRHSLSSQGQNTATPQSPTSVRSSTILETSEWSPEVEATTSPAFRTASVPNTYVETVNWSPSDPTHRPIPTRADTTPLPSAYDHHQYGNTRHSRTFSKDSLSNMRLPPGSAAATKAVVNKTKTAANATAKGVKVAAKKLKNSKNAQRIVAGVGMAAVNAVLIDQFGFSIPVGVGTAAVGLVNSIDFDKNTTVVDTTDTDVTADNATENSVDISGDGDQSSILDSTGNGGQPYIPDDIGDTASVNTASNVASNDYIVGGDAGVVQTTIIQEEIVFIPGAPVPMAQQPQQIRPTSTYGGPQPNNNEASRNAASGPAPGTSEWEFESIMQRPAAMIGSHIPIHVPKSNNQRAVPGTGFQTQRPVQHQGPVPVPMEHGNLPPSHIPVHSHRPPNTMPTQNQPQQHIPAQVHNAGLSQASHQPGWAGQPQIVPQYQGQNQQHSPNQPQIQPLANQAQTQMPNQQQGFQPQGLNQAQFNQQANQPQPQWSQPQNSGPQRPQNQHLNKPPGAVPSQTPSKPLLKPQQKAALMKAGMKIGTSLLKSAIRSSMSGNSGGDYDDDDDDDNDNSYDFGDMSNDGGNDFDSSSNLDNVTADYDPQDQVQDQSDGQDQQFDSGFAGSGFDTGTTSGGNDFGGNDQTGSYDNFPDSGAGYSNIVQDQVPTDTSADTTDLSAQVGFDPSADASFSQQQAIDLQAQGILQTSMNDDNAAMNGFFTTPDFNAQSPSILQTSMQDDNAAMNGYYTTPDFTTQAPGLFQASMADDNAAMNGLSTSSDTFNVQNDGSYDLGTTDSIDPNFSQDTVQDPSVDTDTSSIAADNIWTVNLPDTSSLQSNTASQAYAGLTSASLSGPMFDYYDSFAAYGGEIPLDDESDEDQPQDLATNTDTNSEPQISDLVQGPTLSTTDLDTSQSSQNFITPNSPVLNIDADQQPSDQSQDSDNQSVTQVDDTGSTTPTNTNSGILPPPQVQTAAISQLYDGSAYDDPDSAGSSPSNTQALTPTGMGMPTIAPVGSGTGTGMSGLSTSTPSTPPVLPITPLMPDPMPNLALLTVGQ